MPDQVIITPEEAEKDKEARVAQALASITVKDYDDALEDYCMEVRSARGWTTTDPRTSIGSKVPRWNQDGLDYRDFRDNVLLYGLEVENAFIETGVAPCTLEEFKTHLRTIECHWTYNITEE